MDSLQLAEYVVRPVLQSMDAWSPGAENLLLGTAAQESAMGRYIHQVGGGPALGIYQCEPATHKDIWDNFLVYRDELSEVVRSWSSGRYSDEPELELTGNLFYATAICRIHYMRVSAALPAAENKQAIGQYWKNHYNSVLGAGTVEEFLENYDRYVGA